MIPTPEEESALVEACLAGSEAAWKKLLARYQGAIYAIPRRFGLSEDEAGEVFQNVCLALYRGLPRLRMATGLTRWVLITTRRQARDLAARRRREQHDPEGGLAGRWPDPGPSPERLLEEMETRVRVRAALERLPDRCARLIRWLYLEPERPSYREIASRLGIPEGTIGPTRARCLARMRQVIETSGKGRIK